jgi:multidrug efflux pump subunit AcrB
MEHSDRNDLPSFSVRRPVLVLVLNLLIVLAGVAALIAAEIRELPDVDRPVVSVRASFPGASPETMDAEVISLLEGAIARVSGIKNLRSASEENSGRIYIEFRPGVDLDTAAADVREAVSRVSRRLPERLEQVVVVKADDDAQAVVSLAVSSDSLPMESLTRVVEQEIVPMFLSIGGVADVQVSGDRKRLLRVAVDPFRLSSYGLSVTDVSAALMQAPFDVPAGSFRSLDQQLIVRADATVSSATEVADIVIRDSIRVGDVASVYFGPEDAESLSRLDGKPVLGLGIVRQARSNTIEISAGVNEAVNRINARYPDLSLEVTDDQATARRIARDCHRAYRVVHGEFQSNAWARTRDPGCPDRHDCRYLANGIFHQYTDVACAGPCNGSGSR